MLTCPRGNSIGPLLDNPPGRLRTSEREPFSCAAAIRRSPIYAIGCQWLSIVRENASIIVKTGRDRGLGEKIRSILFPSKASQVSPDPRPEDRNSSGCATKAFGYISAQIFGSVIREADIIPLVGFSTSSRPVCFPPTCFKNLPASVTPRKKRATSNPW